MIRDGKVIAIPHYINKRGPNSPVDLKLKSKWFGFDLQKLIHDEFDKVVTDEFQQEFLSQFDVKNFELS